MIKIKTSHYDGSYIVYDDIDFDKYHTHTKRKDIAIMIMKNVMKKRIPKSRNKQMIISHIRISTDEKYKKKLYAILDDIEKNINFCKKNRNDVYKNISLVNSYRNIKENVRGEPFEYNHILIDRVVSFIYRLHIQPVISPLYEEGVQLEFTNSKDSLTVIINPNNTLILLTMINDVYKEEAFSYMDIKAINKKLDKFFTS